MVSLIPKPAFKIAYYYKRQRQTLDIWSQWGASSDLEAKNVMVGINPDIGSYMHTGPGLDPLPSCHKKMHLAAPPPILLNLSEDAIKKV